MSVDYSLTVRNNRLQQGINATDAAATPGVLRLLDSGGNILSSLVLAVPSATVSNGVATFNGMSLIDPVAAGTGFATAARTENGDGVTVITGLTVGAASPGASYDIFMTPTNYIVAGQAVAISAASITGN